MRVFYNQLPSGGLMVGAALGNLAFPSRAEHQKYLWLADHNSPKSNLGQLFGIESQATKIASWFWLVDPVNHNHNWELTPPGQISWKDFGNHKSSYIYRTASDRLENVWAEYGSKILRLFHKKLGSGEQSGSVASSGGRSGCPQPKSGRINADTVATTTQSK